MKAALDGALDEKDGSVDTMSETSEEDYDALRHDPGAVVTGGKGGGFVAETDNKTPDASGKILYEKIKVESNSMSGPARLKSIPVTLNKLKEKGRYILTADDEALRDILRVGIERVCFFPSENTVCLAHIY